MSLVYTNKPGKRRPVQTVTCKGRTAQSRKFNIDDKKKNKPSAFYDSALALGLGRVISRSRMHTVVGPDAIGLDLVIVSAPPDIIMLGICFCKMYL